MGQNDGYPKEPTSRNNTPMRKLEPNGTEYPDSMGKQPYKVAMIRHEKWRDQSELEGYTFDPDSSDGWCVEFTSHRVAMLKKFTDGTSPLFIIGITNYERVHDERLDLAYDMLQTSKRVPLIGGWIEDKEHIDISHPIDHGVSETEIQRLRAHYAQEALLVIYSENDAEYVYENKREKVPIRGT